MSSTNSDPIRMSRKHGCHRFEGKTAIVTAGTLGIGRAIAQRLCEEGAKVLICSRKKKNVDETVAEMRSLGHDIHGQTCNVGSKTELEAFVQRAVELWGQVDLVVANAAVNPTAGLSLDASEGQYNKVMDINVKSVWQLMKLSKPHMRSGGAVLMVSSNAAYTPSPPLGLYSVSKTALVALAKVLAQELGRDGIRVNVLAPGIIRTHFSSMLWSNDSVGEQARRSLWLQKLGDPEDVAGTAAYLCSDDAAHVTGETVTVAGGAHSRL